MEIREVVDGSHDVDLDNLPARLEERTREPIRPRRLIAWRVEDCLPSLLHGERGPNVTEIAVWSGDTTPIKILKPPSPLLDDGREVAVNNILLVVVVSHPPRIVSKAVNKFFSSPAVDSKVKELSVCVPLFNVRYSRGLSFPSLFKHSQANHPPL